MILVSIDPGKRGCGCALWQDGELRAAAYVPTLNSLEQEMANIVGSMSCAVEDWIDDLPTGLVSIQSLVVEYPQTYGGRASRGDANDLVAVALVAGAIVGCYSHLPIKLILPAEWKGQIPKKTKHGTNPIELRCKKKLSALEVSKIALPSRAALAHNVWDAVGIGLYYLGR